SQPACSRATGASLVRAVPCPAAWLRGSSPVARDLSRPERFTSSAAAEHRCECRLVVELSVSTPPSSRAGPTSRDRAGSRTADRQKTPCTRGGGGGRLCPAHFHFFRCTRLWPAAPDFDDGDEQLRRGIALA